MTVKQLSPELTIKDALTRALELDPPRRVHISPRDWNLLLRDVGGDHRRCGSGVSIELPISGTSVTVECSRHVKDYEYV